MSHFKITLLLLACLFTSLCSCRYLHKVVPTKQHDISEYSDISLKEYNIAYLDPLFVLITKENDKERTERIQKRHIEYDKFNASINFGQYEVDFVVAPGPGHLEISGRHFALRPDRPIVILVQAQDNCVEIQAGEDLENAIGHYINDSNHQRETELHHIIDGLWTSGVR